MVSHENYFKKFEKGKKFTDIEVGQLYTLNWSGNFTVSKCKSVQCYVLKKKPKALFTRPRKLMARVHH